MLYLISFYHPDSFGSFFVLPLTNLSRNSSIHCVIHNMPVTEVKTVVTVRYKQRATGMNDWSYLNVTDHHIRINQSLLLTNSLLFIETNSNNEISLICRIECPGTSCSNEFMVPPVDVLKDRYIIATPDIQNEQNVQVQCHVVTMFNGTSYSIPYLNIHKHNLTFLNHSSFTLPLNAPNPVFIVASHIISVVCFQILHNGYFIQYVLPSMGMKYELSKNDQTNTMFAISMDDNTFVNISNTCTAFCNEYIVLKKAGTRSEEISKKPNSSLSIFANKPIILLGMVSSNCSPTGSNLVYVPPTVNHSRIHNFSNCNSSGPQHFKLFPTEIVSISFKRV